MKKQTRDIMGMPIIVAIADAEVSEEIFEEVFSYFVSIDNQFSTYKTESEISLINAGKVQKDTYSASMQEVFALAEKTKAETNGYFNIFHEGKFDPSGLVKGWAISNAAKLLTDAGYRNFFVDAGGDIQVTGKNQRGELWKVGIRNPFAPQEIIKVLAVTDKGIATSGTYLRGNHIYNPNEMRSSQYIVPKQRIVSLTVIGSTTYEADRFATAAFAMGEAGIHFIERQKGLEGYMIDSRGIATYTRGFDAFVHQPRLNRGQPKRKNV